MLSQCMFYFSPILDLLSLWLLKYFFYCFILALTYAASSLFLLCQTREKALPATFLFFEMTTIQRRGRIK